MARALRLAFEGACYHITSRGNRRENIFYSDNDKKVFIEKLNETLNKYHFICYAYCLMDNHYHLFIKTPDANISEGMHYLNTSYTNWIKAEHNIVGSVLQGRYKSILVEQNNYGLKLSAYIHLNPLRAGMVKNLKQYRWSSYLDYVSDRGKIPERLDKEFILSQFAEDTKEARKRYRSYVKENIGTKDPLAESYRGIALGTGRYINEIVDRIKKIGRKREIIATRPSGTKNAEEIIGLIQKRYGIRKNDIVDKKRGNVYRKISMYLIKKHTDLRLSEIGKIYGMDYAAVAQSCKRFSEELKKDKKIRRMIQDLENEILA
ncbi:MAG TPA: transposase [Thermodesulfobacteriota bacterium]